MGMAWPITRLSEQNMKTFFFINEEDCHLLVAKTFNVTMTVAQSTCY